MTKNVIENPIPAHYVFIDTSIFKKQNFHFSSASLLAMNKLVERGLLKPLITDLVIKEVRKVITDCVNEACQVLKKKHYVLSGARDFESFYSLEHPHTKYSEEINEKFLTYIKNKNFVELKVDTVKASKIFDLYFSKQPPFSIKPDEFPDAFNLEMVYQFALDNGNKVIVVSTDPDYKEYAKNTKDMLVFYESIESVLDTVLEEDDPKRISLVYEYIEGLHIQIQQAVAEYVENKFYYLDFDYEGEVNSVQLDKININEVNVIEYDKEYCLVNVQLNAYVSANVVVGDPANSFYDKSLRRMVFMQRIEGEADSTFKLNCYIGLHIDFEHPDKIDVEKIEIDDRALPSQIFLQDDFFNIDRSRLKVIRFDE